MCNVVEILKKNTCKLFEDKKTIESHNEDKYFLMFVQNCASVFLPGTMPGREGVE